MNEHLPRVASSEAAASRLSAAMFASTDLGRIDALGAAFLAPTPLELLALPAAKVSGSTRSGFFGQVLCQWPNSWQMAHGWIFMSSSVEGLTLEADGKRLTIHDLEEDGQVVLANLLGVVKNIQVHLLARGQRPSSWLNLKNLSV